MAASAFTLNRAEIIDRNFVAFCREQPIGCGMVPKTPLDDPYEDGSALTGRVLRELFESQMASRHLDLMSRILRKENRGFYTINSAGHEGNVVLGRLVRFNDPTFLHYRSGALMAERSRQVAEENYIRVGLLSYMASAADPISGGRHKVWGSVSLCVPPQTSTIASHLPKAVGTALSFERAKHVGVKPVFGAHGEIPDDSIVLCSFGDATVNHSVAQGAINTCCYGAFQNLPLPLLFVCEDNGIGISVHTAAGWIEHFFRGRAPLHYFQADGLDLVNSYQVAADAVEYVRTHRQPAILHMKLVRLLGHAGTDPETEYHTLAEIEAAEAKDPLLASARLMMDAGYMDGQEILELYESVRREVKAETDRLGEQPKLRNAEEVMSSLAPYHPDAVQTEAIRPPSKEARLHAFALKNTPGWSKSATDGNGLPESQPPRHLAVLLNWGLRDLLAKYPEMFVFGEDVAARGGVYYVTAGLTSRFGLGRVFNTLLDETSILGMAIGAGHLGMLPVPEIQYLAYVHNAIDQLRGEACSAQFFSKGQFPNPMVVRIQSLGYQKGFGGHFHNDNSIAALRDIPSLIVAVPSRGDDAVKMLRTCTALAKVDGRVVAFLEPIALYMTKDLYAPGDGQWLSKYPAPDQAIAFGEGRVYEPEAEDLTVLTYGNGLYMSLRAARTLREEHDINVRVVDLRWLSPLYEEFIVQESRASGRVLVVDEGRYSGGVAEAILAILAERCPGVAVSRLTGLDTYIPLGPAANTVIPTEPDIVTAAVGLMAGTKGASARV